MSKSMAETAQAKWQDAPVKVSQYRPSRQVMLLVEMIETSGCNPRKSVWIDEKEKRFNDGYRHGLNCALRQLVELETKITDSDLIDDICADLITESLINRC